MVEAAGDAGRQEVRVEGEERATGEVDRKEPGDSITKKEMDEAGQSANDIESLIASGAIEEA